MQCLLKAIAHCHASKIAHRDIKPENVMIGKEGEIKLIDFGLSRQRKKKGVPMETIVGTPYYIAPEVLEGDYGYECDIWSLGVMLYILLSGYLPFSGKSPAIVFERILEANVSFKQKEWLKVSAEGIDLVKQMLARSPTRRITA